MNVALFQLKIAWEDKDANFEKVASMAIKDIDLVCLPELFATGYTMDSEAFAEPADGETVSFLKDFAKENCVDVIGSYIQRSEGKPKNTAIVIDKSGKVIHNYEKIHLFTREKGNYQAGKKLGVFELGGMKIGVVICYDLRFPEVFRELATKGAEAIFVVASWPSTRTVHWDLLLRARAIENQLFIAGVNRIGEEDKLQYLGHSAIINPFGNVIASTEESKEDVIIGEIDPKEVEKQRQELPFFNDFEGYK